MSTIFSYQQINSAKRAHTLGIFFTVFTTPFFLIFKLQQLFFLPGLSFFFVKRFFSWSLLNTIFFKTLFFFLILFKILLTLMKLDEKKNLDFFFKRIIQFSHEYNAWTKFTADVKKNIYIFFLIGKKNERRKSFVLRSRLELMTEFHYQM